MSSPRMIKLMSSDRETYEVDEAVALESQTLRNMIEDGCANDVIPLPNVASSALIKVIDYCREHRKSGNPEDRAGADKDALKSWDDEFIKAIKSDTNSLIDLILAANYLNIKGLMDLTCQAAADLIIKGETVEEVRKIFNIKCDFTPAEEAAVRAENQWAFEQ